MTDTDAASAEAPAASSDRSTSGHAAGPLTSRQRTALEEERDFLLVSIRDLDEQHHSGELTDDRYESLLAGYTRRAAHVVRILDAARAEPPDEPTAHTRRSRQRRRRLAVIVPLVVVIVFAAVLLPLAISDRGEGETITGNAQNQDAGTRLADAVEERPDDPTARRVYARYLLDRRQFVDALAQFDAAAELDSSDAESRAYGGWILYLAGLTDDALARIDAAIAADPAYPDAHFFRGLILARERSDQRGAVTELRRFLELAPPNAPMRPEVEALLAELQATPGTDE